MNFSEFINETGIVLSPRYGEREARSIALLIAETIGGVSRLQAVADPALRLDAADLWPIVERVKSGEPVQYVLGQAWFGGKIFEVGHGVLIPRPETEGLVEWVAAEHGDSLSILDVGTGSGAIAVSLACRMPDAKITATDISGAALAIASRNACRHGAVITFLHSDILHEKVAGRFDVVVSNPPYIPSGECETMAEHVTGHEPHEALFTPDSDPLLFYRAIVRNTYAGWYYFEVHENYARQVCEMLAAEGCEEVVLREDINAKPRMVRCRKA